MCVSLLIGFPLSRFVRSEWYMNGNYLVVFVSIGIILPLSLLKNLGKDTPCVWVLFILSYYLISASVLLTFHLDTLYVVDEAGSMSLTSV